MGEIRELFRAYKVAHKYREEWYSIKWRVVMILLWATFIWFIWWYLGNKYFFIIEEFQFVLSEKLFYWFMVGMLSGVIAIALIFEGEFLIGLRKIAVELKDARVQLTGEQAKQKAVKRRK